MAGHGLRGDRQRRRQLRLGGAEFRKRNAGDHHRGETLIQWLLQTDAGLLARIFAGCAILALLAGIDLRRNGKAARRWREYLFLAACVAVALLYGIANDQLTVGISWEYFYYGKDLAPALGPTTPPDDFPLRWEAAKVGMQATWAAGVLLGVILLFANNPSPRLSPLPFSRLYRRTLPLTLLCAIFGAAIVGLIGYLGGLLPFNDGFRQLVKDDLFRPKRFMTVYGIHLGGYLGSFAGTILCAILIRRERHQSLPADEACSARARSHT